jgi:energy-coupling factor transporter ATP-binding protein EcfA2
VAPIITLKQVSYTYPPPGTQALRDINISIEKGEFLALMGAKGSGKTTFCRLLNGLIPHSQGGTLKGTVLVDGMAAGETPVSALAAVTGMVLDDPEIQLFTSSVYREAAFGAENLALPRAEIDSRAEEALKTAGLWEYRDASPGKLSGGQKQRLAIAAAIVQAEKILVLDEPVSRLDPAGAEEVFFLLGNLRKKKQLTVVMASHASEAMCRFAGRICVLQNGTIAACGTPGEIFGPLFREEWGIAPPLAAALARFMDKKGEKLPFFPLGIDEAALAVSEWYYGS